MIFFSLDFVQDTNIEYHILRSSSEFKSVSISQEIFTTINADFYHKIAFLISYFQFRLEIGTLNLCYVGVGFDIETLTLELNKRG